MDRKTLAIVFALLRTAVCGVPMSTEEKEAFEPELWEEIYALANRHDVAHLVGLGLKNNGLLDMGSPQGMLFQKAIRMAVYRYEQLNYDFEELCKTLEQGEIAFLPLKGAVIRAYYSEPWMRTSCDIDILVRDRDVEKASKLLEETLGYKVGKRDVHDVSMYSPNESHVELHYSLIEDGLIKNASEVLKSVWDTSSNKSGYTYWYEMSDELFYFYHVAHMAKHFELGGCGIRSFIDLWILDNIAQRNVELRTALLKRGDLLQFAQIAQRLSQVWLEDKSQDSVTSKVEAYILQGGVYGERENRVIMQQQKKGGRFKYLLSQIFLPYSALRRIYPILYKHWWLFPFMQVRRWFSILFTKKLKTSVQKAKRDNDIWKTKADEAQRLLQDVGLLNKE